MVNLDDLNFLATLDQSHCLASLKNFSSQLKTAWHQATNISLPGDIKPVHVLFCAMGGSAYAGRIIKYLYTDTSGFSTEVVDDYNLPAYSAKAETLIICASYSGNTEETVSVLRQALARKIKTVVVAGGGVLAGIAEKNNLPLYLFQDSLNPSGQPRLGQGYMIASQLAILAKAGLINLTTEEFMQAVAYLQEKDGVYSGDNPVTGNPAKSLSIELENRSPVLIAGSFLKGALHAVRNPLNETGKHFSDYFILPELNHHLLEGLRFPEKNRDLLQFLMIDSDLYPDKIRLRLKLTAEIIKKNKLSLKVITLEGKDKITQILELLQLFGFVSFYLAILHQVDPAAVPYVDYFKQKLA